ncbi:MAG: hypothetical protein ABI361_03145 [Nitrososphaera sp.]
MIGQAFVRYATISAIVFALVFPALAFNKKVYADGLFMENLPPASVGNRDASLFVRINPPVLVSGSNSDAYLQLRLFDAKTNETIKSTTFDITVTKGVEKDAKVIMEQVFTTDSGLLTLHITPTNGSVTVNANQDPFLNAWQADPGGDIKISGPLLLDGGLYHFHIRILTVDNIRNLFSDTNAPTFDSYLSVGDVTNRNISQSGQQYNATLISYYDKANGFSLNPSAKTFTWSMPFNWNATRIKNAPSFLVHEEVRIPKSLKDIGDTNSFNATVNGQPLQGRQLIVDPFTYSNAVVVHYLLAKNDVLNMATSGVKNNTSMNFALSPASAPVAENQTSGEWRAERSNVIVTWTPSQLASGKDSTLHLQFIDTQGTGQQISGNVHYDLTVKDMDGNVVISKPGLVAKGGQDTQTLNFPADKTYRTEAKITSIDYQNLPSDIRVDYARGVVVVPEFPAGSLIAIAGIVAAAIAVQRLVKKNPA